MNIITINTPLTCAKDASCFGVLFLDDASLKLSLCILRISYRRRKVNYNLVWGEGGGEPADLTSYNDMFDIVHTRDIVGRGPPFAYWRKVPIPRFVLECYVISL